MHHTAFGFKTVSKLGRVGLSTVEASAGVDIAKLLPVSVLFGFEVIALHCIQP
jgi:hypothetical protein